MQWVKDVVGRTGSGSQDNQLSVGSDRRMGSSRTPVAPMGSFKNPEAAQLAVQNVNSDSNPYVFDRHLSALAIDDLSTNGFKDTEKCPHHTVQEDPESADEPQVGSSECEEVEVVTAAQVLVTIPGAVVHLIDDEESVHLATGDFSLVRFFQERTKLVVIAKVGDDLKWPLVQEEPTVKLDPTHYYFTLKVPLNMDDVRSSEEPTNSLETGRTEMDTLNYGVTFPAGLGSEQSARIRELDYFLERYSTFSDPTVVQGDSKQSKTLSDSEDKLPSLQDPSFPGKVVPATDLSGDGQVTANEDTSAVFWTTIAPNVADYNSKAAKGIAIGAGHIIRGIFWFSDSTEKNLASGHGYMKSRFKPKKEKSKISSVTMGSVRRVRKLSGMTDKVSKGVLGGILYTTGLVSTAVVHSAPGKRFFKLMPGEVALVSLEAFGRIFDAIELAGTKVVTKSSLVTQDFVDYRYGEAAKELTDESFKAAGHAASTVWTVTKIRKALNPKKLKVSKSSLAKSVAKQVVSGSKKA